MVVFIPIAHELSEYNAELPSRRCNLPSSGTAETGDDSIASATYDKLCGVQISTLRSGHRTCIYTTLFTPPYGEYSKDV